MAVLRSLRKATSANALHGLLVEPSLIADTPAQIDGLEARTVLLTQLAQLREHIALQGVALGLQVFEGISGLSWETPCLKPSSEGMFGNEGVGTLRAPGLAKFDFSLQRNFRLNGATRLEFRGEFFNAFNRTNLGLPGDIFGASSFGVISSAAPAREVQLGARIAF